MIETFALLFVLGQDAAALNDRAQGLAQQGRGEEAAELWRGALKGAPGYFPAAFNLGFYHARRKEFGEAERYLRMAAKADGRDFNTRFLLGQALEAQGKRDEALREWRAGIEIQPAHARLLGIMAVAYLEGGYLREAAKVAKRAAALRPEDLNAHLLAVKACQEAQDAEGPEMARRGAERFAGSARAVFEHAWYLQRAGRNEESGEWLRKAIALDGEYEEPHYFLGGILLEQGRMEEAVGHLRRAVEIRRDYTVAAVALGRALMEMEKPGEAREVLEEAQRMAPRHPQPPLMLARLYYRAGEGERAKAAKELSLRLRRENGALMEARQSREFRP
jgi:tetratricopeptide (TPR) repeat protein